MRCTVTGAGGFIGSALVPVLERAGMAVQRWDRREGDFDLAHTDAATASRWTQKLLGVDALVHLAGVAHRSATAAHYDSVNRDGTHCLASAAAQAGVRRFVFISSAKVFGEGHSHPYTPQSPAHPEDDYGRSKWAAEQALLAIAAGTGMEVAIIRPPLVYGPGVRGNFQRLWRLAQSPLPLPFAAVDNRRDMIGIDNLLDLIARCLHSASAPGRIWLCSDGAPYSLGEIIAAIRRAHGRQPRLYALPRSLLEGLGGAVLGDGARKLFGDFQLDIEATQAALDWSPRIALAQTLARMVGH